MKSRFAFFICFITITGISCSSSKHSSQHLPGIWQQQPIVIDGYNNDWPSPYPEYDDKSMLGYAVSNDKDNLYITIETGDLATQLKILHTGLTVWIDKTGGREATTAINFPLPDQYKSHKNTEEKKSQKEQWQQAQQTRPEHRRFELEDRVKKAMENADEFSLQGFKGCNRQFSLLERDSCGIVTKLAIDSTNEMVWEAVIPFRSFYYKSAITKQDKGKPISICFETTGMQKPAGQAGGRSRGGGGFRPSIGMGGMGVGMGGMRGGGQYGGNRSAAQDAANNMMEPLYKTTKTIKRFGLAWQE